MKRANKRRTIAHIADSFPYNLCCIQMIICIFCEFYDTFNLYGFFFLSSLVSLVHTHNNECLSVRFFFLLQFDVLACCFAFLLAKLSYLPLRERMQCKSHLFIQKKKKTVRIEFTHSLMWFQTCGGKRERERALSASRHVVITEFENFSRCYIHSVYDSVVYFFFNFFGSTSNNSRSTFESSSFYIIYIYLHTFFCALF